MRLLFSYLCDLIRKVCVVANRSSAFFGVCNFGCTHFLFMEEKKMKKMISLLLCFVMVLTFIPLSKIESSALTFEDFTYEIISESKKTAQITDYSGKAKELTIPNNIEGYSIISIGERAFQSCKTLETVTISEGITSIDEYAFAYCDNLELVNLPEGLTVIEDWAFSRSRNLKKLYFYDNFKSLGSSVFYDCPSLIEIGVSEDNENFLSDNGVLFSKDKTVLKCYPAGKTELKYSIPESVTSIDTGAFAFCKIINEVIVSTNVTKIPLWTFEECIALESVTIPSSVKTIEGYAFDGCKSLSDIHYDGSESDWNRVSIYDGNDFLKVANIHFSKEADFEITTDETITLKYEANRIFDFVVSDTSIAKIGNVSTSSISWGSTVNIVSSAEIIPLKPGLVKVNVVDKSGNILTTSTLLIKEGNHKMKLDKTIKEATCTVNGEELYVCEFCGYEEIKTITKDHSFGEWKTTVSPTCTQSGLKTATCTCGKTKTETIPANGHSFGEWKVTKQPTVNEEGIESRSCVCGEVETRKIDKLNSSKGDVNGDGKITAVDARMILQIVAGLKTYNDEIILTADVNGDGKISAVDARMILQIVAGLL